MNYARAALVKASRSLGCGALCVLLLVQSAPSDASAYESEAALIIKIGKFVHWPPGTFTNSAGIVRLCVLGTDDDGDGIDRLAGQKLQEKTIAVARLSSPVESVTGCHIVFIRKSERDRLSGVLAATARSAVLTVSDIAGFASAGGMVGFSTADGGTQFEINVAAAKRAGLAIGAQLLQIAALGTEARPDAGP
jgi:YfiR/HmsC-like